MKYHSENIVPMIGASDISPSWNQFRAPLFAGISIVLMAAGMTFLMRHFRVGLTPSDSSCSEGFYRLDRRADKAWRARCRMPSGQC